MSTSISLNNTENTTNIHVKLQFNDEFRRFFIPMNPSIKFTDLELKIKSLLRLEKEISIKYKDEEDEWITISSDVELETGLMIAGNHVFRLLCLLKEDNCPLSTTCITSSTDEVQQQHPQNSWKRNKRGDSYPRKDRKWKKHYEKKSSGGNPNPSEEMTLETPQNLTNETPVLHEDNANEDNESKKEWKRREKREKRQQKRDRKDGEKRKKKNYRNEGDDGTSSSSESNSDVALMTLDEIKVELSRLKEEEGLLKEKLRAAKESWKFAKENVKAKRKEENVNTDVILGLREDLTNKKNEKKKVQAQLRITRGRMNKLRDAAETKQN